MGLHTKWNNNKKSGSWSVSPPPRRLQIDSCAKLKWNCGDCADLDFSGWNKICWLIKHIVLDIFWTETEMISQVMKVATNCVECVFSPFFGCRCLTAVCPLIYLAIQEKFMRSTWRVTAKTSLNLCWVLMANIYHGCLPTLHVMATSHSSRHSKSGWFSFFPRWDMLLPWRVPTDCWILFTKHLN